MIPDLDFFKKRIFTWGAEEFSIKRTKMNRLTPPGKVEHFEEELSMGHRCPPPPPSILTLRMWITTVGLLSGLVSHLIVTVATHWQNSLLGGKAIVDHSFKGSCASWHGGHGNLCWSDHSRRVQSKGNTSPQLVFSLSSLLFHLDPQPKRWYLSYSDGFSPHSYPSPDTPSNIYTWKCALSIS